MEKDKFFVNVSKSPLQPNWHSQSSGTDIQGTDIQLGNMNCVPEQLQSGFLNLNWENSLDHSAPFEPALNSIVSSPATVATSYSTTSCYNTPLNSPSKLNLSTIPGNLMTAPTSLVPFSADPGFAERAAKFSCFGGGNYGGPAGQLGFNDTELLHRSVLKMGSGKLSRVSSIQSLRTGSEVGVLDNKETGLPDGLEAEMRSISPSSLDRKFSRLSRSSTPDDVEFANAREESSPSDGITGGDVSLNGPIDINVRKRKAFTRGKPKEFLSSPSAKDPKVAEENDSNAKRSKSTEANMAAKDSAEQNGIPNAVDCGQKQTKDNTKPPEPPKQDYIHVRARRGQATDSHSLAERVRREKISERMKFLQDLVPGCNKVTGKAVMLDEIINYVQSLQRQVEFLSMKLANVNPRLDLNMETLLSKNILQSHGPGPNSMFPLDSSAPAFLYGQQPQHGPVHSITSNGSEAPSSVIPLDLHRNLGAQLATIDGCGDASSHLANFWEDDLQSVVQMGFGQNQETAFPFHGSLPTTHMKVEL